MLRSRIDRGVYVRPATVIEGWSGACAVVCVAGVACVSNGFSVSSATHACATLAVGSHAALSVAEPAISDVWNVLFVKSPTNPFLRIDATSAGYHRRNSALS